MGIFSNPKCPRCGRETTYASDYYNGHYTCIPCKNKLKKEKKEKDSLLKRVQILENKLKDK